MISTFQIFIAGLVTAAAIAFAARSVGWDPASSIAAAALGWVLIVAWRAAANQLSLNEDFLPTVSLGDVLCGPVGATGPALVTLLGSRGRPLR